MVRERKGSNASRGVSLDRQNNHISKHGPFGLRRHFLFCMSRSISSSELEKKDEESTQRSTGHEAWWRKGLWVGASDEPQSRDWAVIEFTRGQPTGTPLAYSLEERGRDSEFTSKSPYRGTRGRRGGLPWYPGRAQYCSMSSTQLARAARREIDRPALGIPNGLQDI